MKVMLVMNYAPDRQESMRRFGELLTRELPALGVEPAVVAPVPRLGRLAPRYRYAGWPKYLGYADKFLLFPRQLRREIDRQRPDVVHIIDHANSTYARAAGRTPVLATCHDLLQIRAARGEFNGHRPGWAGRRLQRWILREISAVPDLACVSGKTEEDVNRLLPHPGPRTHLIPNGLNFPFAPVPPSRARARLRALAPGDWADRDFYVNVGGGQWYKNRPGLLAIFAEICQRVDPPPALVLVGKPLSAADRERAVALGVAAHLVHLPNLPGYDLAACYSVARGLIFPSWEEGFGWPVAEAQACGCPVFASDRAPLTEVGGTAAVYFDPAEPAGAADRIVAARPREADLRERGLARAAEWAPQRMAAAYAKLYRQLAGHTA